MRLTFWEWFQCFAPKRIELLEAAQLPKAFGHQKLEKNKMIPNDVTDVTYSQGDPPPQSSAPAPASADWRAAQSLRTSVSPKIKKKWYEQKWLTFWERTQLPASSVLVTENEGLQVDQMSEAFGHQQLKIKYFRKMRLTFWEWSQSIAQLQVKLREAGQLPEAFGHQIWENKMIPKNATYLQEDSGSARSPPCWAPLGWPDVRSLRRTKIRK